MPAPLIDLNDLAQDIAEANGLQDVLTVEYTMVSPEAADLICDALRDPNGMISGLQLRWCSFESTDLLPRILHAATSSENRVSRLSFTGYTIIDRGAIESLAAGLIHPLNSISELHFDDCNIGNPSHAAEHFGLAMEALKHPNNKVRVLLLRDVYVGGPEGTRILYDVLRHPNNGIRDLTLDNFNLYLLPLYTLQGRVRCDLCGVNQLRSGFHARPKRDLCRKCMNMVLSGVKEDGKPLDDPVVLEQMRELDLNKQTAGERYIEFSPANIERVRFEPLPAGGEGLRSFEMIASALTDPNCKVGHLALSRTEMGGKEGMRLLTEMMRNPSKPIRSLSMSTMRIGDEESIGELAVALTAPRNDIDSLMFTSLDVTDGMVEAISRSLLSPHNVLRSLTLPEINTRGARALLDAIPRSLLTSFACELGEDTDFDVFVDLGHVAGVIESEWFKVVLALASIKFIPRLGLNSKAKALPLDLIRRVAETLPDMDTESFFGI